MSRRPHLSAATALLLGGIVLCMGAPGFSAIGPHALKTEQQRRKAARTVPAALVDVGVVLADLNRAVRVPIMRRLLPLQRLFRIKSDFHLYGGGPRHPMRLELRVDGDLIYRTRDADHAWRSAQLEYRRVRPTVETLAKKAGAYNWEGMQRWMLREVRSDFPDARQVVLSGTLSRPGTDAPRTRHGRVADAPEWAFRPLTDEERAGIDAGTWP